MANSMASDDKNGVLRLSKEDLDHCTAERICFDCYRQDLAIPAIKWQIRRKYRVPCCHNHFFAYRKKVNKEGQEKYSKTSAKKQASRLCTYKGCHRKLIPQELLPPRIQERTCGLHGTFKPFRFNRLAILRLITLHYLTPEERKSMTAQNIIYKPREGLVWFSAREAGFYVTKGFSAHDLFELHKRSR